MLHRLTPCRSLTGARLVSVLFLGLAAPAFGASNILTPAGDYAVGYRADDYFTDRGVIGAFDVFGNQVAIWGTSGVQILNRTTGAVEESPGGIPQEYFDALPSEVDVYNSSTTIDPSGNSVWVGFTTTGNVDDRIYEAVKQAESRWQWTHKATLTGNFEIEFYGGNAYASANPTAGVWGTDSSIYLVDTSLPGGLPASTHDLIAAIGGYSAGLTFDGDGNLYYGSYLLDLNWNSYGALYKFDSAAVSSAVGGGNLTLADAQKLADLLHGVSDTEVDLAGHLMFTMKQFQGPNYVAMWDGRNVGSGYNYEVIADGTGAEGNFLFFLKASGDFTNDGVLYVGDGEYLPYPGIAGITVVPEPSTIVMVLSVALCCLYWWRRRAGGR